MATTPAEAPAARPADTPHTVLVLGAGSSFEAGLPVGAQLKTAIANLLDIRFENFGRGGHTGDNGIVEAFRAVTRDINPLLHDSWRIRDAMPQALSIDNFLDAHRGQAQIELAGKLGIVQSILQAERASKLFINPNANPPTLNFATLQNTWFNKFFQTLTENCRFEDLKGRLRSIVIVNFNYDRCIDHFLLHSIQNYYLVDPQAAAQALSHLRILHPYGSVGSLPHVNPSQPMNHVALGANFQGNRLLEVSRGIKTFTEGTDETSSEILAIRELVQNAKRLVFLGFAYHPLNMELLFPKPDAITERNGLVLGTAYGISESDKKAISKDLHERSGIAGEYEFPDLTCSDFFVKYSRTLSMA